MPDVLKSQIIKSLVLNRLSSKWAQTRSVKTTTSEKVNAVLIGGYGFKLHV